MAEKEKITIKILKVNGENATVEYADGERQEVILAKSVADSVSVGQRGLALIVSKFKGVNNGYDYIVNSFSPLEEEQEAESDLMVADFFENEEILFEEKPAETGKKASKTTKEKEIPLKSDNDLSKSLNEEQRARFNQIVKIAKSFGADCNNEIIETLAVSKVLLQSNCREAILLNVAEESYEKLKEKGVI